MKQKKKKYVKQVNIRKASRIITIIIIIASTYHSSGGLSASGISNCMPWAGNTRKTASDIRLEKYKS
jgi:hypothetical protein